MGATAESVELIDDELVTNLVRAALFAALVGAFAYVSFPYPFSPVPVTLQVLGVFLAGIMLGPVWGGVALGLYLLAGIAGAPVFAFGTAGLGVVFGESGGFILSFPLAAFVIGGIVHGGLSVTDPRDVSLVRLVVALSAGIVVIYTLGVIGMMLVLSLSLGEAILVGALAFLPAEAIKMAGAIGIVRSERLTAM